MASSDTSSNMRENNFGFENSKYDSKGNDKKATADLINAEVNRQNINLESYAGDNKNDLLSIKENTNDTNESMQHKQKHFINSDKETSFINNDHDYGIKFKSEYKNENNVADNNTIIEVLEITKDYTNVDDNLPSTVTLLKTPDGGKCYIVGTAHFSIESQNDVSKVIQAVQPHVVMVELCSDRIHILELDEDALLNEAKNLDFNKMMYIIKNNGVYKGLFYILLLNMSVHLTKVLGLAPGGEFRRALLEAKKIPHCFVHIGDRPIKITFARALSFLTWWQKIKLTWQLLTDKEIISQNDVEKYKNRDLIEEIMADLAGEYPALGEVFVKERDIYLTHSLQLACEPKIGMFGELIPARVVGVVGIGHTFGIIQNWGKVTKSQILPIMSIPPPSLSSKILKFTIKTSVVGIVIYAGYKLIPIPVNLVLSLKPSIKGFLKINSN